MHIELIHFSHQRAISIECVVRIVSSLWLPSQIEHASTQDCNAHLQLNILNYLLPRGETRNRASMKTHSSKGICLGFLLRGQNMCGTGCTTWAILYLQWLARRTCARENAMQMNELARWNDHTKADAMNTNRRALFDNPTL